jgi:ABC-type multidrug transport system fused ATPase/permease subunit
LRLPCSTGKRNQTPGGVLLLLRAASINTEPHLQPRWIHPTRREVTIAQIPAYLSDKSREHRALRHQTTRGALLPNRAKAAILRRHMAALEIQGVSKHFGAILALDDESLTLRGGEVIGLMGDNGAGKSTLVKISAGNFRPSHGKLLIDGKEVTFHRPVEARWYGIEIVDQDLALCSLRTVRQPD